MSSRHKRKLEDFDPNKSDSDDLDYDASAAPRARPSGGSRSARKHKRSGGASKSSKRRRQTYGGSDDDIEDESDELDSDDEEVSFDDDSEEEEVELNPRTGRGVRSVAKKAVKYEESDDEAEPDFDNDTPSADESPAPKALARKKQRSDLLKPSKIVKLQIPVNKLRAMSDDRAAKRARPGSRSSHKDGPTPSATGTRRSSRISQDDREELVALTDSMKHEVVTRTGTATPEPVGTRRPTRGGKGLKKPPSAIMEASQEGTTADMTSFALRDQLEDAAFEADEQTTTLKQVSQTSPEDAPGDEDIQMEDAAAEEEAEHVVQESQPDPEDNDEDDGPVSRGGRGLRNRRKASTPPASQTADTGGRRTLRNRKAAVEPSSDFEPDADGENEAEEEMSEDDLLKPTEATSAEGSASGRRSGRLRGKASSQRSRSRRNASEDEADEELDVDEIADEAAELDEDARRNRRPTRRQPRASEITYEPKLRDRGKKPDYRIWRPENLLNVEEEEAMVAATTPSRNRRGGGGNYFRSLFNVAGPFGGAGGPPPVFGGPDGAGAAAAGGVDSDSSDDEGGQRGGGAAGVGGTVGMTPTSAFPKPYAPQAHNNDPIQGAGGGPPGLGKVKDRKALADADPLGVDPNVNFDGVGGLDNHINQLKEMVMLPLLYPELFLRFKVTPPRGVLFHGPPGTGKTLLARALASSVSSGGRKVTFYMRKGADALSKWVGEAEKQLRLLFEEARKNQPSIIFFDEIDGLAPVRSSKQEQIHASIVATLLALMDGMDGRGQVIVIGATNRPDSVDPALRRPGRFDREFYFPLPDKDGRRKILDIHTKGWDPPLAPAFKDQLAGLTRGYGGADLRALCTEAALNAVQGTFPQIYSSTQKLIVDPAQIKVLAKDFMLSVHKIIPSSARSAAAPPTPLTPTVEPLLRAPLAACAARLDSLLPRRKHATALEEAMYDDRDDPFGFEKETLLRDFDAARVFRPRLLIHGREGMGQQYLGAALLSRLEGLHVQSFDLPTLLKDSTRSPEAAVVQLFEEVKRHKPGIIYIPNINVWFQALSDSAIKTFTGLLRSLPPTDPVLLLGIMDTDINDPDLDPGVRRLFGYSTENLYSLQRPSKEARAEFFTPILDLIRKSPREFPDLENRKKRKLAELPLAPVEAPRGPTEAELREQKKKDRLTLNQLRLHILTVMEQIKKYKRFRTPVVDEGLISYLFDEQDPATLSTDLGAEQHRQQQQQMYRPYELDKDKHGHPGIREVATGKFYYNLEIVTIEKRLANGYYKRPQDFAADFRRIAKDAKVSGDAERTVKANELLATVEVDMAHLEQQFPALAAECEAVYAREKERERKQIEKAQEARRRGEPVPIITANVPPPTDSKTTEGSGPIVLGQPIPGRPPLFPLTPNRTAAAQPLVNSSSTSHNHWSHSNGNHASQHTNGSTVPSRPREDTELFEASPTDHTMGAQQQPQQGGSQFSQTQPGLQTQHSTLTHMMPGSQIDQYQNSASTTTSGQKTQPSARTSGGTSNGTTSEYPDFDGMAPSGGSQLPDTQPPSNASQQQSRSDKSQPPQTQPQENSPDHQMGPPRRESRAAPIADLLNDANANEEEAENHTLILDDQHLATLHAGMVQASSGLSLEQLEQVHAALMAVVWRLRSDWNRNKISLAVQEAFNAAVLDIEACQEVFEPSQITMHGRGGGRGMTSTAVATTIGGRGSASQLSAGGLVYSGEVGKSEGPRDRDVVMG